MADSSTLRAQAWRFSINWRIDGQEGGLYTWTAPADLRCGDRLVLYEGGRGNRQAFVAIGRAVTDAVRAHAGDKTHWAWVEWEFDVCHVSFASAKRHGITIVNGRHRRLAADQLDHLWTAMTGEDRLARTVAKRFRDGQGYPTTDKVPIHVLFDSKWNYRPHHELAMYERVTRVLEAQGQRVDDSLTRIVRPLRGATPTDPAADRRLIPDIVTFSETDGVVLVTEVKRRAVHSDHSDYDPVAQVVNYAECIRDILRGTDFGGFRVQSMLAAWEFDARELAHAREADVPCRKVMKRSGELRPV